MEFPKSTPDLDHPLAAPRKSRRESRNQRVSRECKENGWMVSNPFRQGQGGLLPEQLLSQIEKMDYISSNSIKNIQFSQLPKRKSNFEKNLVMMQQLVQQQQDKYCMMREGRDIEPPSPMQMQYIANSFPLSLDEQDQISLQLNFYDQRDRIEDDFNIFSNEMDEEEVVFYSNNELEAPQLMDEEVGSYFG